MAILLEPVIHSTLPGNIDNDFVVLVIQTLISTIPVLFIAEFLPKSLFLINPNNLLSFFAVPIFLIYRIMYIPVYAVVFLSRLLIQKILKLPFSEDKQVFRLTDLNNFMRETLRIQNEKKKHEVNKKIFNNALEFKTVKVRECMIPRTEINAVSLDNDIEELKKVFIETGHSKILVYKSSIDDVVGCCHSLDLFKNPKNISDILASIIIVPETMLVNELMIQLITDRKSLALVVDEFGGTSGLISMEDIIEEIFGEIQDEHDDENWIEQQIDEKTFVLSARHEIDYLNDKFGWRIPISDYDTLGGYILSITEDIPQPNQTITTDSFTIIIQTMIDNRIDTVKLIRDSLPPQNSN